MATEIKIALVPADTLTENGKIDLIRNHMVKSEYFKCTNLSQECMTCDNRCLKPNPEAEKCEKWDECKFRGVIPCGDCPEKPESDRKHDKVCSHEPNYVCVNQICFSCDAIVNYTKPEPEKCCKDCRYDTVCKTKEREVNCGCYVSNKPESVKEIMPLIQDSELLEEICAGCLKDDDISDADCKACRRDWQFIARLQRDADQKILETKEKEWNKRTEDLIAAKSIMFAQASDKVLKEWRQEEPDWLEKLNVILKTGNTDPVYETIEAEITDLHKEAGE